jgi:hypothetical protein
MEHNPDCSMKTIHELCESRFCEGIGKKIFGERRDGYWRHMCEPMLLENFGRILVKKGS